MPNKALILVDGSSYLYRAFHAMPSLSNSKGKATGAVYGVINMLRKLIADHDPEHIAVVFDAKGRTFRDDIYDKYKATRSSMPEELATQIEPIHKVIKAMGLPILMIEGVEADDVIGTIAKNAAKKGIQTLISTGDKDLAQLVDDHITLVNTMTDTVLTPQTVIDKFGIPPESIIDYLTLVGDTSDNIPGVPQVGPKTAVKWLEQYGSLDNIVAHADKFKGKVGENLRSSLHQLPMTRQLVTIKLDVAIKESIEDLSRRAPNTEELIDLYRELEFKTWLAQLLEKKSSTEEAPPTQLAREIILTEKQLEDCIEILSKKDILVIDTPHTLEHYMDAQLGGITFAATGTKSFYIPFGHDYEGAPKQLSEALVLQKLKPLLENPAIKKIGHGIKYDIEVLANYDITLNGVAYDVMMESYILDSSNSNHDLEALALKYLGLRMIREEDILGKGTKQISLRQINIDTAASYATEIAEVTLQLHNTLWPRLSSEPGLKHIFEKIELPLISVLANMERTGVLIDATKLSQQSLELEKRLIELEEQAFAEAGGPFNLNSPKQLQEILFTKLQLPALQKTPTGQPSTADAVLQELALDYSLPKLIIEYRSLSKLITTYTKRLPQQIHSVTGRVHTSYNQTGAATGRLSSSEPNLQNIPIRTAEGRRIRQAFIARPGYKIVSADYSQIELRIMSHISNDPTLLSAFERNLDVHQATAAEVLGLALNDITQEQRRSAKAVNFGLIYGMSAFGLARQLGIGRQEAQDYIEKYFARYPLVREYMDNTRAQAHNKGYVETLSGRRLYLPEINSSQMMRQKAAERAAINAPLQGTAADIIKRAMIKIDAWLRDEKIDANMIMQVHDELVFEVAENSAEPIMESIRKLMMSAAVLKVPLVVSIGIGENWDAASAH